MESRHAFGIAYSALAPRVSSLMMPISISTTRPDGLGSEGGADASLSERYRLGIERDSWN